MANRLRFDFTHTGPLTEGQVESLEDWVNTAIQQDLELHSTVLWPPRLRVVLTLQVMSYKDALEANATSLMSERYPENVRVIDVPVRNHLVCIGTISSVAHSD